LYVLCCLESKDLIGQLDNSMGYILLTMVLVSLNDRFLVCSFKIVLNSVGFNLNLTIPWVVIILTMVLVNLNNR